MENQQLVEGKFYAGAIKDTIDTRDYKWSDIAKAKASEDFDWEKGFDIEEEIGRKILPVKQQSENWGCGGMAWSYWGEVNEFIKSGTYEERSAKFIYAQARATSGGSAGRDLCKVAKNKGFAKELLCSSYNADGTALSEEDISDVSTISDEAYLDGLSCQTLEALSYGNVSPDINEMAQAIRDNNGICIGVTGQNGKGWLTAFPQPPEKRSWGHWLYAGKAKLIDGKKYIGVLNSWGDDVGEEGWQWLGEDYFNAEITGSDSGKAVWYGWAMVMEEITPEQEKKTLLQVIASLLIKLFKK